MRLNGTKAPWASVLVMWGVGILFLLPSPGWQIMVKYITSITVLTYGLGPTVLLLVLRRRRPDLERPLRLMGAEAIAPIAFICSNWIIEWTGFKTNSFLFGLIAIGSILYELYFHLIARQPAAAFGCRNISWLMPWFSRT